MVTADSVKEKLQGLIDQANAATGGTDADLTAAISSLIAGYGQGGSDPVLEELRITENGTYTPGDGVDGFSKVIADIASSGGSGGASGVYMAQVTPTEDTSPLSVTHNLGTTDILFALAWAETLGDIVPTFNGALGKFWTKYDGAINVSSSIQVTENFETQAYYNTGAVAAYCGAPNSDAYRSAVIDENTFSFARAGSAKALWIAGVTYTVVIMAASAFSVTEV